MNTDTKENQFPQCDEQSCDRLPEGAQDVISILEKNKIADNGGYNGIFHIPGNGWNDFFIQETSKPYFKELELFVKERINAGATVYPPLENVFNCFRHTDRENVKVVILGQDPYHQPGQAMGLSFSVPEGVKVPPSLVNIFKEINSDTGEPSVIKGGDLTPWAKSGVLLLNSLLTVERSQPMSHKGKGWETFTDTVIKEISQGEIPCVFMLWGRPAMSKIPLIDGKKHLILSTVHPSPLSAYGGFFGCRHFSRANEFLAAKGISPVKW